MATAAVTCFNLGHAYQEIPAIRDLTKAEDWYRRSLELRDKRDRQGQARCVGQLGSVALQRFGEARAARGFIGGILSLLFRRSSKAKLLRHINAALQSYQQVLELLPANAVDDLAAVHNQLGLVYDEAGDIDRALPHYRESIRLEETQGDLYGAAGTRVNVAASLAESGRLADAREYALAALRNYETYGEAATDKVQETQQLVAEIEQDIAKGPSS